MQKNQGNYEKILIVIMAVAAIAAGGWFIYASTTFPATLDRKNVQVRPFVENVPVQDMEEATQRAMADAKVWTAPIRNNKAVPLFKSVLLVLKDDQIYDMFLEDPQLRPPLTNKWLRENTLQYLVPNVADLDPDEDGFSNVEEFDAGTNPNDANSHPPITNKLFLVQRIEHKFLITLRSSGDPPQVTITTEDGHRRSYFTEIGKGFGEGGRFVPKKFEKKTVIDTKTNSEKDVSELTIEDTLRKNEVVLVKDAEQNLANYEGVFEFRLKTIEMVKGFKGDPFRIPGHDETTYRILDIQEDGATIATVDAQNKTGPPILIKRG
jgi:hypothetical protein